MADRTNLITNPSFETGTTGWSSYFSAGLAQSSTRSVVGAYSLSCTGSNGVLGGAQTAGTGTSGIPVTPGTTYKLAASVYSARTIVSSDATWWDASGVEISGGAAQGIGATANTWSTITWSWTAPTGAAYAQFAIYLQPLDTSEVFYIDAVILELSSTYSGYFDGDTSDTATVNYAWTGTAHASTSTATAIKSGTASGSFDFSGSSTGVTPVAGIGSANPGTYDFAGSVSGVTPFNPPTGLTATPISGTQINLGWDMNLDAGWYQVERNGSVIAERVLTNSYSDTGLSPGTSYDYRVRSAKNHI